MQAAIAVATPGGPETSGFCASRPETGSSMPPLAAQSHQNAECRTESGDPRAGKYLAFLLGREEFAIQVLKVREIMGIQEITAVPQTPAYMKGVINLRGKVIPVVDLRLKFNLPEMDYTQRTCIIVVQVQSAGVVLQTGIIVDTVSEVLNLAAGDVEDTPDFGAGSLSAFSYLLGMAKVKGKVKILLDIDQILSSDEIHGLGSVLG